MKHAGPAALAALEGLVAEIARLPGVAERKPGVFYRKGQAFLHFHEDAAGLFADVKEAGAWVRLDVSEEAGRLGCLAEVKRILAGR